jgi:predicted house-cleaning noncanonical NTP pyrophosphatase (MazG superfamily)
MMDIDKEYNENLSAKLVEEEEDYVRDHIQQITNPIN